MKGKLKTLIVAGVVFAVIVAGFSTTISEKRKSYLDGNILNLPYLNATYSAQHKFQSPWSYQQLESLFMHRSLFSPSSNLKYLEGDLAENYTMSNNSKTYTIFLGNNNYWSDGNLVVAEDVVFTIKAMSEFEGINSIFNMALDFIEGIDEYRNGDSDEISGLIVEGNVLTINLKESYNSFLPILSQAVILPKHILGDEDFATLQESDYWENPITNGMYKFDEIVQDEDTDDYYFSLTHNEYYKGDKSDIEEIRLHINYKDENLDYYSTNNIMEIEYYNDASYTEYIADMLLYRYFAFNVSDETGFVNKPMDDIRIRQAIMYAIDRETLLETAYLNDGKIINSGVINNETTKNKFEFDLEKAKSLLEEAEYDFDRPFVIAYYHTDELSQNFLKGVASLLEDIGMKIEMLYVTSNQELYVDKKYDMLYKGLSTYNELFWYSEYASNHATMKSLYSWDGEFDDIYVELYQSKTDDAYNKQLLVVQEWEQEHLYKLPMFALDQKVFINDDRLDIPDNIEFGNPWYRHNLEIENWSIKKD